MLQEAQANPDCVDQLTESDHNEAITFAVGEQFEVPAHLVPSLATGGAFFMANPVSTLVRFQ